MIIAVSGIRDLHVDSYDVVQVTMRDLVADPHVKEIRFGGAEGADTIALYTAGLARNYADRVGLRLTVIVPFTLKQMKNEPHHVAHRYAHRIIELNLARFIDDKFNNGAYHIRNAALLDGPPGEPVRADKLVAFTDGRKSGGTYGTKLLADDRSIPIDRVVVRGTKETR